MKLKRGICRYITYQINVKPPSKVTSSLRMETPHFPREKPDDPWGKK
jgi:hypothetical protein